MEMPLYNQNAESIGTVNAPDALFGVAMNKDLLYQVVTSLTANQRQSIANTKGRSEVRGGGKKPWQQKGTGRARHGSIRSPIWKGGGVTHGPTAEKNFKKKINRAVLRKALAVALSEKNRAGQVAILDTIALEKAKTKAMAHIIKTISSILPGYGKSKKGISSVLFIIPASSETQTLVRAARNLPMVHVTQASDVNALQVLTSKYTVFLKDALDNISKRVS